MISSNVTLCPHCISGQCIFTANVFQGSPECRLKKKSQNSQFLAFKVLLFGNLIWCYLFFKGVVVVCCTVFILFSDVAPLDRCLFSTFIDILKAILDTILNILGNAAKNVILSHQTCLIAGCFVLLGCIKRRKERNIYIFFSFSRECKGVKKGNLPKYYRGSVNGISVKRVLDNKSLSLFL